ncbi:MAG: PAS domain-containing protein, partial [Rhodobacteraceae bacterium]|nr:PAS domain-containing protein [Paracoccaceae bacterium]
MTTKPSKQGDTVLLEQLDHIAKGLAETLSPFCEVVVHDLTHPENAIMAIYNNLSERKVGEPATELGLARIQDRDFPQVIANYANAFRDGRRAKSTSIGIRGARGDYVAALCLNVDLTLFNNLQSAIHEFTRVDMQEPLMESLSPANVEALHGAIDQFAARRSKTPRSLKADERKALVKE